MKKKISIVVLVFTLIIPFYGISQDIYVYGNIRKTDAENIKSLFKLISQKFKTKKNNLFYEINPPFVYRRKNLNSDILLDAELASIASSTQAKRYSAEEINKIKVNIVTITNGKKRLITFNKKGDSSPPTYFNDYNKLIDFISDPHNKEKDFVVLVILNKEKPVTIIKTPKENQKTSKSQIEGISVSADSIAQVLVRVNGKEWMSAIGLSTWAIETELQADNNLIESMSIDKFNDTSEVVKISNVSFEAPKIDPLSVNYIYPNENQNVVPKCQTDVDGYNYNFKISFEPSIKLSSIQMVVENSRHQEIYSITLDQLSDVSKRELPRNNNIEFCFFLIYTILGTKDPCAIDKTENYYYYLRSSYGEKINFPPKIKIHFESFNQTIGANAFCNCD